MQYELASWCKPTVEVVIEQTKVHNISKLVAPTSNFLATIT